MLDDYRLGTTRPKVCMYVRSGTEMSVPLYLGTVCMFYVFRYGGTYHTYLTYIDWMDVITFLFLVCATFCPALIGNYGANNFLELIMQ